MAFLLIAAPLAVSGAPAPSPPPAAANVPPGSVLVDGLQLRAAPRDPVRSVRILDNAGTILLLEGRRGLDLILSGSCLEPALPGLDPRVRIENDAGETLDLDLPRPEVTRGENARVFTARYRLDLSRFQKPFRTVRLQGVVARPEAVRSETRRLELSLVNPVGPLDLGPLRVTVTPDASAEGGPTVTALAEWSEPPAGEHGAPVPPSHAAVTGAVTADLRTAGSDCMLVETRSRSIEATAGRRQQTFTWRTAAGPPAELVLSYRVAPVKMTSFSLDQVEVPAPAPPALGRMQAQLMVLDGPLENVVTPEDLLEIPAPGPVSHPLLDHRAGGALRFQVVLHGEPAGAGVVQAALSPRRGSGWGAWYWFAGETDTEGAALFGDLVAGEYRIRLRFRGPGAPASVEAGELRATVPPRRTVHLRALLSGAPESR